MSPSPFEAFGADIAAALSQRDQIRLLTDVVIALEDAGVVRLCGARDGPCPYPSDVARALYERGVRVSSETQVSSK